VRRGCGQRLMLHVEQNMDRVSGQHKVDQHRRQKDQMLRSLVGVPVPVAQSSTCVLQPQPPMRATRCLPYRFTPKQDP